MHELEGRVQPDVSDGHSDLNHEESCNSPLPLRSISSHSTMDVGFPAEMVHGEQLADLRVAMLGPLPTPPPTPPPKNPHTAPPPAR